MPTRLEQFYLRKETTPLYSELTRENPFIIRNSRAVGNITVDYITAEGKNHSIRFALVNPNPNLLEPSLEWMSEETLAAIRKGTQWVSGKENAEVVPVDDAKFTKYKEDLFRELLYTEKLSHLSPEISKYLSNKEEVSSKEGVPNKETKEEKEPNPYKMLITSLATTFNPTADDLLGMLTKEKFVNASPQHQKELTDAIIERCNKDKHLLVDMIKHVSAEIRDAGANDAPNVAVQACNLFQNYYKTDDTFRRNFENILMNDFGTPKKSIDYLREKQNDPKIFQQVIVVAGYMLDRSWEASGPKTEINKP